jgi:hypothetical protein
MQNSIFEMKPHLYTLPQPLPSREGGFKFPLPSWERARERGDSRKQITWLTLLTLNVTEIRYQTLRNERF